MNKDPRNIFYILGIIIVLVSLFLWREINNYRSISTEVVTEPIVADNATPLPITAEDQILGNPGAPLTIVEYINLNDAKSKRLNSIIMNFVNENPQKARAIFKHATVSGIFSDNSEANRATWCAGKQKKTWEYLALLNENKNNVKTETLQANAKQLKLNYDMWWACAEGEKSKAAVEADTAEAKRLGLGKPPLIFINNKKLNTDLGFDLKEFFLSLIAE